MVGALYAADGTAPDVLAAVAREFSPRIEAFGAPGIEAREVVLDLGGLERVFGSAREIGDQLRRSAADRGLRVRVAIAGTRTAARLIVRHRAGVTVIEPGMEASALAPLPLALLAVVADEAAAPVRPLSGAPERSTFRVPRDEDDVLRTLRRWGLRTLGDLAALPADQVAARLGQRGIRWQALARGEDERPMVPSVPEERFEQSLDLEWPIEGLEPLSFVLGRLMEPLAARLERRDRGAAVLHVRLDLVPTPDDLHGDDDGCRAGGSPSAEAGKRRQRVHERSLLLPAPMRDARTLRTLALLDLESHPPAGPIERVVVAVEPTPARIVQFSLLTRPLPSPERLSTLMARLTALMGEGRCGSPAEVDSWQPGACAMRPFTPRLDGGGVESGRREPRAPVLALRRFRFPVAARVQVEQGVPVCVRAHGIAGGRVERCAGPWRTSGGWWAETEQMRARACGAAKDDGGDAGAAHAWDRDEWDVALSDGVTCRVFRERGTGRWFVEGVVD